MIEVSTTREGEVDEMRPAVLKQKIRYLFDKCLGRYAHGKSEGGIGQDMGWSYSADEHGPTLKGFRK